MENACAEELELIVPHLSLHTVLESADLIKYEEHFQGLGLDLEMFLNLQPEHMSRVLPAPKFGIADHLNFLSKYLKFLKQNNLDIPVGFGSEVEAVPSVSLSTEAMSPVINDIPVGFGSEVEAVPPVSLSTVSMSPVINVHHVESSYSDEDDPDYLPQNTIGNKDPQLQESTSNQNPGTSNTSKPLVNKESLGSRRNISIQASSEIEKLDLEELLKSDTAGDGALSIFKQTQILSDLDRTHITRIIVNWLVRTIQLPKQHHYVAVAKKIVQLFPTERESTWYIAPFSEGASQKDPRGRLPVKVKNTKAFLRKKGSLEPSAYERKKRKLDVQEASTLEPSVEMTAEVLAATEWLKRNREPFEDVVYHWKVCQGYRLRDLLLVNGTLKPSEYVEKWHDILLHPQAYKLVLSDYAFLHQLEKYSHLEGTSNALLAKWPSVSEKLERLVRERDQVVDFSHIRDILPLLDETPSLSADAKDLILLKFLSAMCKPRGRVKVGKQTFKPTSIEAENNFVLHISGDLENVIAEKRRNRHKKKATLQPFVIAVGGDVKDVRHFYVSVDKILWKVNSLLQAIDICFKSFFVFDAEYAPEAYHLWLFIQHALYGIIMPGEKSVANVNTLIDRLNANES